MKKVQSDDKITREELLTGINEAVNLVKKTLGYHGETVLLRSYRQDPATKQMYPQWKITKDGVSVINDIFFRDEMKDNGVSMVKASAQATVDSAGDGTTLTSILCQMLMNGVNDAINNGSQKRALKAGIEKAAEFIIDEIKKASEPIIKDEVIDLQLVKDIAMVSSNSDTEIADIVTDAISKTKNGMITVEPSVDHKTTLETVDGVLLAGSITSNYFINNMAKQICELENCYILIYDRELVKFKPLRPLIEQFTKVQQQAIQNGAQQPSLLIICHDCKDEALTMLVANHQRGGLNVGVIKMADFGEQRKRILEDIAVVTDGEFLADHKGSVLEKVKLPQLGRAKKVIIEKNDTIIIPEVVEEALEGEQLTPAQEHARNRKAILANYLKDLKAQIDNATDDEIKKMAETRYAHLTGGVGVIRIGGKTTDEVQEKLDRVDDALCASRSAIKEGYVAGGGSLYLKLTLGLDGILCTNDSEAMGINIVKKALTEPFKQLMTNAGVEVTENLVDSVLLTEQNIGYNQKTDKVEDLVQAGIIDSAMVLRVALENSVASALLFASLGGSSTPDK